jgi:hypothetical protein
MVMMVVVWGGDERESWRRTAEVLLESTMPSLTSCFFHCHLIHDATTTHKEQ